MGKIILISMAGILLGIAFIGGLSFGESRYEQGETLFNDKCVLCHGKGGEGNGPAAVAFSPKPANFTDPKFWQNIDDRKIANTIRKGHGMMPAFDLSPDQIQTIIEYLKHFKK
jgi:mono/diheme cytochrome c family protein